MKNVIKKSTIVGAGVVELVADHVVCEEGKPISPEAADSGMNYYAMVGICLI
jgi:hypothetical protein